MTERPWTPGPWGRGGAHNSVAIPRTWDDIEEKTYISLLTGPHCRADAGLIALAPEMAEAILDFAAAVDSNSRDDSQRVHEQIYRMAQKLRKVGSE